MNEPTEKINNEAEQHIKELNELGANIQPDGVVETAIKELGGRVTEIESPDTLIQKTPDGTFERIDKNGAHYDENGNIILQGQEQEIKE